MDTTRSWWIERWRLTGWRMWVRVRRLTSSYWQVSSLCIVLGDAPSGAHTTLVCTAGGGMHLRAACTTVDAAAGLEPPMADALAATLGVRRRHLPRELHRRRAEILHEGGQGWFRRHGVEPVMSAYIESSPDY